MPFSLRQRTARPPSIGQVALALIPVRLAALALTPCCFTCPNVQHSTCFPFPAIFLRPPTTIIRCGPFFTCGGTVLFLLFHMFLSHFSAGCPRIAVHLSSQAAGSVHSNRLAPRWPSARSSLEFTQFCGVLGSVFSNQCFPTILPQLVFLWHLISRVHPTPVHLCPI